MAPDGVPAEGLPGEPPELVVEVALAPAARIDGLVAVCALTAIVAGGMKRSNRTNP